MLVMIAQLSYFAINICTKILGVSEGCHYSLSKLSQRLGQEMILVCISSLKSMKHLHRNEM